MPSSDESRPRSTRRTRRFGRFRSAAFHPGLRLGLGLTVAAGALGATAASRLPSGAPEGEGALLRELPRIDVARMPVEVTERVEHWVERFQTDERPTFELFMSRAGRYGDLIRDRLLEREMPAELLYLAMIESGFAPGATSERAAVGIWQFLGPTAREYGLRVDDWVDERRDPLRATDAALGYLEWLHDRYGSWYLAVAAYNSGPGRVDWALRHLPPNRPDPAADPYWAIEHLLPAETREHVPRLLAATLLARDIGGHGFEVRPTEPFTYDRVWVPGGTELREVARALRLPTQRVSELNPHLIRLTTPPGGVYALRVPVGGVTQVVASLGGGPWATALGDD